MKKNILITLLAVCVAAISCQPIKKVAVPAPSADVAPTIKITSFAVAGTTDLPDNGISSNDQTVHVSVGASLNILGSAQNLLGGVKQFSITVTKLPENTSVTSTVSAPSVQDSQQPTLLNIIGVGNQPNNPTKFNFATAEDKLVVVAVAENFNGMTTSITTNFVAAQLRRRISGVSLFTLDKKDNADGYSAQNGFLFVTHDPGCGAKGNDGTDRFTFNNALLNNYGVKIEKFEFHQFWPIERGPYNPWSFAGAGSYGARASNHSLYAIDWNNSCQDPYNNKRLYYVASFIVSMPPGLSLNEPTYDPDSQSIGDYPIPAGYQWNESPEPAPSTNTAPSGFIGTAFYCNGTQAKARGILEITASLQTPIAGAQGDNMMNEKIPVDFDPSGGGQPSRFVFRTATTYKQGTWKITKVKITGLTGDLQTVPLMVNLPGAPVFNFNMNACP